MDACRPLHVRNNDDLSEAEQCSMTLAKQSRGSREKRPHDDLGMCGASMTEKIQNGYFQPQEGQSLEPFVTEENTNPRMECF